MASQLLGLASDRKSTLRILFTAAEADPLIKIGGLGDVAGSLPSQLKQIHKVDARKIDLDVRLVIPYHKVISPIYREHKTIAEFSIQTRNSILPAYVYSSEINGVTVYLIDGKPIAEYDTVYSRNTKKDGSKYIFFSLACLKLIEVLDWQADILHANDWHTALAIYAHSIDKTKRLTQLSISTLITLHNLPYMGAGLGSILKKYNIPPSSDPDLPEWSRHIPLPMGLSTADAIVAVSPNYSREIQSEEHGCGLHNFLKKNRSKIFGIVNGIDYLIWNPEKDLYIEEKYSTTNLDARLKNKLALQSEFDFPQESKTPLLLLISRMDIQKGIDLAIEALRILKDQTWQAIFLGTGDPILENAVLALEKELPSKVRSVLRFDSALSHRMYAGADILLMPSRYEPCGLSQLIAMRYGCIPVAHATGGLVDTIQKEPRSKKTGYLFDISTPESMSVKIAEALSAYKKNTSWRNLQTRAMNQDFSWKNSAIEYARLYLKLMQKSKGE